MTSNAFKLSNILINGTSNVDPVMIDSHVAGTFLDVVSSPGDLPVSGNALGDQRWATSTNKLFFWNGTAWINTTVSNYLPSVPSGVENSYNLALDGTATVITATSTDPDGTAISWTYSTTGVTTQAAIGQSTNVFTITPSTVPANNGIFYLTISATSNTNTVAKTTKITLAH